MSYAVNVIALGRCRSIAHGLPWLLFGFAHCLPTDSPLLRVTLATVYDRLLACRSGGTTLTKHSEPKPRQADSLSYITRPPSLSDTFTVRFSQPPVIEMPQQ